MIPSDIEAGELRPGPPVHPDLLVEAVGRYLGVGYVHWLLGSRAVAAGWLNCVVPVNTVGTWAVRSGRRRDGVAEGRVGLEQAFELFQRKSGGLYNTRHGEGVNRVVSRDDQDGVAIRHGNVFSLPLDGETSFFKGAHRLDVIDAGEFWHLSRRLRPRLRGSRAQRCSQRRPRDKFLWRP